MQESILCFLTKIWSFYPQSKNFSCSVTLKTIILVRAINKCFQKYFQNVKTYYKQPKKTFTKTECKSESKLIKNYR